MLTSKGKGATEPRRSVGTSRWAMRHEVPVPDQGLGSSAGSARATATSALPKVAVTTLAPGAAFTQFAESPIEDLDARSRDGSRCLNALLHGGEVPRWRVDHVPGAAVAQLGTAVLAKRQEQRSCKDGTAAGKTRENPRRKVLVVWLSNALRPSAICSRVLRDGFSASG